MIDKMMNVARWTIGSGLLLGALGLGAYGLANAGESWRWESDDDEHEEYGEYRDLIASRETNGVDQLRGVDSQLYVEECGACHLAYPAGFLPQRSWSALMSGLDDHFGENAELAPETQTQVLEYLVANASEYSSNRRAKKFAGSLASDQVPLRITELNYFKRKHDEIPDRLVTGNTEVVSFSQCDSCHGERAQDGYFDEDTVDIPGHGRWDD